LTVPRVTELRSPFPEAGKRLLPLPIAAWHAGRDQANRRHEFMRLSLDTELRRQYVRLLGELEAESS